MSKKKDLYCKCNSEWLNAWRKFEIRYKTKIEMHDYCPKCRFYKWALTPRQKVNWDTMVKKLS
jgi:hypothetical protein